LTRRLRLVGTGFTSGLKTLPGLQFDPEFPYTACLLCGEVYQSVIDRKVPAGATPINSLLAKVAKERRDVWARSHAAQEHTTREHTQLALSGRTMTPEAAFTLAAFGLIPLIDMVIDEEVSDALARSNAIPNVDAQGA